ncbi:CIS tube protein [Spongorhabdus nitratireducens]
MALPEMTIQAYKDEKYATKAGGELSIPFAIETLKLRLANQISGPGVINGSSGYAAYQGGETAALHVTLKYDTVIADNPATLSLGYKQLKDKLSAFMTAAYTMNGDTHEANFLMLSCGEMLLGDGKPGDAFHCRLADIRLRYTQVDKEGRPTAFEAACTFVESLAAKTIRKLENKSSPDLTHIRLVKEQESLPWKTWDIYRDPGYLIGVAEVNGLDSLRQLNPGDSLIFPPLEK